MINCKSCGKKLGFFEICCDLFDWFNLYCEPCYYKKQIKDYQKYLNEFLNRMKNGQESKKL